ncbi:hypothetical protein DFH08DRAFT_956775 [Mycena albidolilacea]|uniref:Uncharacterized protein n=1 Tax=Mycena albidolilacea TaxID=1033008 RepID=A0AAD7EV37_9AGAR|nr:hypothetical protein DFH08DRAFT_956775 [Mycena albidolilacea]
MKFALVLPAVLLSVGMHAAAGNCKPGLWYCGKYLHKLELRKSPPLLHPPPFPSPAFFVVMHPINTVAAKYEFITTQAAFNGQLHPDGIPDTLMLCNTEPQGPLERHLSARSTHKPSPPVSAHDSPWLGPLVDRNENTIYLHMPDPGDYSSDDDDPSSTQRSAGADALIKSLPSAMGCFAPEPVLQRAPTTSSRSLYARGAHIPYSSSHVSPLLQGPPSHPRTRMPATPAWYELGQPQLFPWAIPSGDSVCAYRTGGSSASMARCTLHRAIRRRKHRCKLCRRRLVCRPRGRMREPDRAIFEPVRVAAARSVRTAEV